MLECLHMHSSVLLVSVDKTPSSLSIGVPQSYSSGEISTICYILRTVMLTVLGKENAHFSAHLNNQNNAWRY